jgi:hypothetical protein
VESIDVVIDLETLFEMMYFNALMDHELYIIILAQKKCMMQEDFEMII